DFTYRADTTPNGSGSRVTDQNGAIVGIHQRGGCNGDNPETGANGGTTLAAPGLRAAIQARCGTNICPAVATRDPTWTGFKTRYKWEGVVRMRDSRRTRIGGGEPLTGRMKAFAASLACIVLALAVPSSGSAAASSPSSRLRTTFVPPRHVENVVVNAGRG